MTPEELKKRTATWRRRRPRKHGLDDTDEQIAPGKDDPLGDDWMSLSAVQMDRFHNRAKADRLVASLRKKRFRK